VYVHTGKECERRRPRVVCGKEKEAAQLSYQPQRREREHEQQLEETDDFSFFLFAVERVSRLSKE
jgi:hypothetical protein